MNVLKVKEHNKLYKRKQGLELALDRVKLRMGVLDKEIQDEFANDGIDKITVGGRTLSVSGMIWAKYGEGNREKVIEALRKCPETQSLVVDGFNAARLSGYIREKIRQWEMLPEKTRPKSPLPKELTGVVGWVENFSIKSTVAGK